jgi:hypothetical protein
MNFLIKFFSTLAILFIIWIAIVFFQTRNDTKMSQWVYDVYEKKSKIANNIKEKKIIIVSGSNALFGIDSKMLGDAFKIPVVNFGVNAGVLLPYTLYKAKEVIKDGDIVLLPLEYPMYSYNGMPNEQMIDFIFSRDMGIFFNLSLREQFYMVWNITFKRLKDGYEALGGAKVTKGLYGAHNVNRYGDQVGATLKSKSKSIKKELNALKANRYGSEYNSDALGWKYLEEFVSWCDKKGVQTIFTPSTMLKFNIYKKDKKERWFYENISNEVKKRGWIYLGDPYDYMYTKKYYFNTDFHLINMGRIKRTKQMILDLKGKI